MLKKNLIKIGNSWCILLDKPLLKLAGLKDGGLVSIELENGKIILTPVKLAK
jgi:antitoxin component of MazEF toxin-antitoxin module